MGSNPGGCGFGTRASCRCLLSTRCLNPGIVPVSCIPCPSGTRHPAGAKLYKREDSEYVRVCAAPSPHSSRGVMDKASASESEWLRVRIPEGALLAAGAWLLLTRAWQKYPGSSLNQGAPGSTRIQRLHSSVVRAMRM